MITIPKELTAKFFNSALYPLGTGTFDWVDIKTSFEVLNDEIAGVVFTFDQGKMISRNNLEESQINLNNFKNRTFEHVPKDDSEKSEQELLLRKVDSGLAIYKWILDRIV